MSALDVFVFVAVCENVVDGGVLVFVCFVDILDTGLFLDCLMESFVVVESLDLLPKRLSKSSLAFEMSDFLLFCCFFLFLFLLVPLVFLTEIGLSLQPAEIGK